MHEFKEVLGEEFDELVVLYSEWADEFMSRSYVLMMVGAKFDELAVLASEWADGVGG